MMPATAAIDFHTTWRPFADRGAEDLRNAITEHGYTLTVIDTLARVLGRVDHDDMGDMTAIQFEIDDIVRSGFVRDFIIAENELGLY